MGPHRQDGSECMEIRKGQVKKGHSNNKLHDSQLG